jgi:outer membrane protein OmpA-like peptidoglycan-associated protein
MGVRLIYAQDIYAPVNIGPKVNSKFGEISPYLSADGREMYFLRSMPRKGATDNVQSLWYSRMDEKGEWGVAKYMAPPFNVGLRNSSVDGISTDNNVILIKGYFINGTRSDTFGYSLIKRENNTWKTPEGIEIDNLNTLRRGEYVGAQMTPDSKAILIYFSEAKGSKNSDLYICFKTADKHYSAPKYLKALNTQYDESGMFLASDNRTLYFSSDRSGGLGDNDIYKSTRLDDTWDKWSEPVNMGPTINSDKWDNYFTVDARGEFAYMVSSKEGGQGESDIVRIKLKEELKPQPVILVKGLVLDKSTNKSIEAGIKYDELRSGRNEGIAISDAVTGAYQISLPYGENYSFNASAENYISISDNIDLTKISDFKEITRNLYLVPITKGQVVRINNIFFDTGKSDLKPESFPELNRLAELLEKREKLEIELGGHTDNVGSDDVNFTLSGQRALSVQSYLLAKGISAARIKSTGYGKTKPETTNDTEEGRAINRRVEFTILNM